MLEPVVRQAGWTVWGRQRPSVLVWLVIDDGARQRLVGLETLEGGSQLGTLQRRAKLRGVPLVVPLMDLEDQNGVSVLDVRGGYMRPILQASYRYATDGVWYGVLERLDENLWQIGWTVLMDDQVIRWRNDGEFAESVLREGVDELADRLAAQYRLPMTAAGEQLFTVTVHAVNSLRAYVDVLAHLQGLNSVTQVQVQGLEQDRIQVLLRSTGDEAVLRQAIDLGETLRVFEGAHEGLEFVLR